MKLFLLLIGYVFASMLSFAQPILTGANSNLVVGDINTISLYDWVAPGNSGANQAWDFSSITTHTTNNNIMTYTITSIPSSISSQYSNANIFLDYTYGGNIYNTNSTVFQSYGSYDATSSNNNLIYQDPMDILRYPFTYGNSFTDSYNGSQGSKFSKATATVTVDGYGTLSLPMGTFSNVLRVYTHTVGKDSTSSSNQVLFVRDEYRWYLPGNHYPILQNTIGNYGASNYKDLIMLNNISVGISEIRSVIQSFNVYPNPNSGAILNLDLNFKKNSEYTIVITDNIGRELLSVCSDKGFEGYNFKTIDVSDLESGIYNFGIRLENGSLANKKITIQK